MGSFHDNSSLVSDVFRFGVPACLNPAGPRYAEGHSEKQIFESNHLIKIGEERAKIRNFREKTWRGKTVNTSAKLCIFCASGSGVLQAKKTLQSRRQKHRKLQWFLKLCFEKRKLARSFMAASDVFFEIHVLKNIEKQEMACMFGAFLHFFYRSFAFLDPRAWRTPKPLFMQGCFGAPACAPKSAGYSRSWGAPL